MTCYSADGQCNQTTCEVDEKCAYPTTTDFWRGEFGNEYTRRNRVDWRQRVPFWRDVLDQTGARSVFEGGCNAGWNLSAIKGAAGIHHQMIRTYGCDLNHDAFIQATWALPNPGIVYGGIVESILAHDEQDMTTARFDLTFTAGVLIHIPPEDLAKTMQALVKGSAQYVLAVEYESEQEEEIEYRGHQGKLWRRNYGRLYEGMGLKLVKKWDAGQGFDNCTAWLLEKQV